MWLFTYQLEIQVKERFYIAFEGELIFSRGFYDLSEKLKLNYYLQVAIFRLGHALFTSGDIVTHSV